MFARLESPSRRFDFRRPGLATIIREDEKREKGQVGHR